jgi:FkbM family methyltransferase
MTFKTITRRGRDWLWPAYDTELIKVFDQVDDIDTILKYCPNRRVAIQAGGACGVWPDRLSQSFETVYTFEPDPINFMCLAYNVFGATKFQCALANDSQGTHITRHATEKTNAGATYCSGNSGPVPTVRIDDVLPFFGCDLIQFDIEGYEAEALHGARNMIDICEPTIVIEEKPLPQGGDHLAARRLLESWGYRERERIHRDVIFTHD